MNWLTKVLIAYRHGWSVVDWAEPGQLTMRRGDKHEPYLIIIDNDGTVRNGY